MKKKGRVLYFDRNDNRRKKRQKMILHIPPERQRLRPNVEAIVHEFTCRMPKKKLKVRGAFKFTLFTFTAAMIINFGRIFRYLIENPEKFGLLFNFIVKFFKELAARVQKFVRMMSGDEFRCAMYNF